MGGGLKSQFVEGGGRLRALRGGEKSQIVNSGREREREVRGRAWSFGEMGRGMVGLG